MGEIAIAIERDGGSLVARWTGKSQSVDPASVLAPVFSELVLLAVAEGLPVIHDFCALDFFNSATVSAIIRHIKVLGESKVLTTVRYDGGLRWQRSFFDALAVTAATTEHLTVLSIPSVKP